ncbi:MAG TPA: hypothetical protein VLH13_00185, partial [Methanomassiliicoccales archaeon]|nr:hypothetical protein [Methanomassiliicoccales archaeon]
MSKGDKVSKNGGNGADKEIDGLKVRMGELQRIAHDKGIPLVVIFEGWDIWGIPEKVNHFIRALDPRGYELYFINGPEGTDEGRPFIWHHFIRMPARGTIAIFDRSWYFRLVDDLYDSDRKNEFENHLHYIDMMESQHANDGWVFVKFFLSIEKNDLAKRMKRTVKKDICAGRMQLDGDYSDDYDDVFPIWQDVIKRTDKPYSPWTVIEDDDEDEVLLRIFRTTNAALEDAIAREGAPEVTYASYAAQKKKGELARTDMLRKLEQNIYRKKL